MKKICIFVLVFVSFFIPSRASAYLSDEWIRECGTVRFTEGNFFMNGLRLYSRAYWQEIFNYINKNICVEGYAEKRMGKNIGVSFHSISETFPEITHMAPSTKTPAVIEIEVGGKAPSKHLEGIQTYYGFLVRGRNDRVLLQLDNGQIILLLHRVWNDSYAGPKFFIEGQAIIRENIIRSIKNPVIYSFEEYERAHPPFIDNNGNMINDWDYNKFKEDQMIIEIR